MIGHLFDWYYMAKHNRIVDQQLKTMITVGDLFFYMVTRPTYLFRQRRLSSQVR
jgi:hypothetical protein